MINKVRNLTIFMTFLFLPLSTQAAGKTFLITPETAKATFRGQYLGLSSFNGQFHDISGKITSDPEKPDNDNIQITINTCSLEMADKSLSSKVKSPSFLDCRRFPIITFYSTMAQWQQGANLEVKGLLTLHGITREIRLNTKLDRQNIINKKALNFQGVISLNRLDFDVGSRFSVIDDEITISFDLSALEDITQTAELK